MAQLAGKVAVITGASMGIGAAIAEVYAGYGAKLVLVDVLPQVGEMADRLQARGTQAIPVLADVASVQDTQRVAAAAIEKFGRVDVLVNNAGIYRSSPFGETGEAQLEALISVNIKGVWNTTQAILPHMIRQGSGSVVVISSVSGNYLSDPGDVAYGLSKAAVLGFTRGLAAEAQQHNIRVNAICPGRVKTDLAIGYARQQNPADPEGALSEMSRKLPYRRMAEPKEIAELAAFLGWDGSSYINGSDIVIDGGLRFMPGDLA